MKKILLIVVIAYTQIAYAQTVTYEKKYHGDTLYKVTWEPVLVGVKGINNTLASKVYTATSFPVMDTETFNRPMKFPAGTVFLEERTRVSSYTKFISPNGLSRVVASTEFPPIETVGKNFIWNKPFVISIVLLCILARFFRSVIIGDIITDNQKSPMYGLIGIVLMVSIIFVMINHLIWISNISKSICFWDWYLFILAILILSPILMIKNMEKIAAERLRKREEMR